MTTSFFFSFFSSYLNSSSLRWQNSGEIVHQENLTGSAYDLFFFITFQFLSNSAAFAYLAQNLKEMYEMRHSKKEQNNKMKETKLKCSDCTLFYVFLEETESLTQVEFAWNCLFILNYYFLIRVHICLEMTGKLFSINHLFKGELTIVAWSHSLIILSLSVSHSL